MAPLSSWYASLLKNKYWKVSAYTRPQNQGAMQRDGDPVPAMRCGETEVVCALRAAAGGVEEEEELCWPLAAPIAFVKAVGGMATFVQESIGPREVHAELLTFLPEYDQCNVSRGERSHGLLVLQTCRVAVAKPPSGCQSAIGCTASRPQTRF